MVNRYTPNCGDVVWLHFDPILGHEQGGKRPALVVSSKIYNAIGLSLVCPITSKVKSYPFEVAIAGTIEGVILSDQVRCVDWRARAMVFIEHAEAKVMVRVQKNLELMITQ